MTERLDRIEGLLLTTAERLNETNATLAKTNTTLEQTNASPEAFQTWLIQLANVNSRVDVLEQAS